MRLIMTTHHREPSYLDATLESLFTSDFSVKRLDLLVHETTVIDPISDITTKYPEVIHSSLTQEEHDAKMRLHRRTKVAHATRLALETVDDECVLLQDDAVFADGWLQTFEQELESFGPNRAWSCIALCHHLRHQVKDGILPWDPRGYWGLVAMYLGSEARKRFVEALKRWEAHPWPSPGQGADMCLRDMLVKSRGVRLFARYPALVTHTGHVSSIGSPSLRKKALKHPHKPHVPVTFVAPRAAATFVGPAPKPAPGKSTKPRKNPNPPVKFTRKP